jgi:hypothetical protein
MSCNFTAPFGATNSYVPALKRFFLLQKMYSTMQPFLGAEGGEKVDKSQQYTPSIRTGSTLVFTLIKTCSMTIETKTTFKKSVAFMLSSLRYCT